MAPFDQTFPLDEDDVNVTLPPEQKLVGPLAAMDGVGGNEFTVTTVGDEVAVHEPLLLETVYDPPAETVMLCVVAPFDQTFPEVDDEVRVTVSPEHNVVLPLAKMLGVAGVEFTVTATVDDTELQPPTFVTVTL